MDVYLLGFAALQQTLPQPLQPHLEPLRSMLLGRQVREHGLLVEATDSARFGKLMADWRAFLQAEPPRRSTLPNAQRPVADVAAESIWRTYKRTLREAEAIGPQSPPEALHQLRKTCKKLRYLLEFFRSLYPAKAMGRMTAELKGLQQHLGEFQDLVVQSHTLEGFRAEAEQRAKTGPETVVAVDVLLEQLAGRSLEVRAELAPALARFMRRSNRKLARALFRPRKRPSSTPAQNGGEAS